MLLVYRNSVSAADQPQSTALHTVHSSTNAVQFYCHRHGAITQELQNSW